MTAGVRDATGGALDPAGVDHLRPLFAPRGIVVIGASRDPSKLGAVMTRSLSGFPGPVAGVNSRDADPGERRFATVAEAADAVGRPSTSR